MPLTLGNLSIYSGAYKKKKLREIDVDVPSLCLEF